MTHELKIWPEYFDDVASGKKTFEVRKLDRPFGTGDELWLREWSPSQGYSGRETRKIVTYVMTGGQWGLAEGNCIMGIKDETPSPTTGEVEEDRAEALREENEQLRERVKELESFARNVANNYDCDTDNHKYQNGVGCRSCEAKQLLNNKQG